MSNLLDNFLRVIVFLVVVGDGKQQLSRNDFLSSQVIPYMESVFLAS